MNDDEDDKKSYVQRNVLKIICMFFSSKQHWDNKFTYSLFK